MIGLDKNFNIKLSINILTLTRLPMSVIFILLVIRYLENSNIKSGVAALGVSLIIMMSDYMDGFLARKFNCISKTGQTFDVYCDFIYIFLSILTMSLYNITPRYFVWIISFKFFEFILISNIYRKKTIRKNASNYYYDLLGRIVSVIYYIIPSFQLALLLLNYNYLGIAIKIVIFLVTILTFVGSFIKIKNSFNMNL